MNEALDLGAALAAGLMIGIERGWHLRRERSGTRIAGVRTYSLIGLGGGLAALLGLLVHPLLSVVVAGTIAAVLGIVQLRQAAPDLTGFVSALVTLALGLIAGAGQPALAVAGGAVVTLMLSARRELHGFVGRLRSEDVRAFARYAVIVAAVLPFLPNRALGPYGAWNPFKLWLVVVLVTGFSFVGYIANRTIGARRGILATAIIGGAYSSTAVTASFAERMHRGEVGPFGAGIALASAVMYLRAAALMALFAPSAFLPYLLINLPAAVVALGAAGLMWWRAPAGSGGPGKPASNPIEIVPALGFAIVVALAALGTRWALNRFGSAGTAWSLFLTGSFDIDASIITLGGLPPQSIARELAAIAIAGTTVSNMLLKMGITLAYGGRRGFAPAAAMAASTMVLAASILFAFTRL